MSKSWRKRKARLGTLLESKGDEDEDGLALDRILHGQSVIGKTSKTSQIDSLRFSDDDLHVVGTLEYGQFGVIDLVTCKFDGKSYVRKSTNKHFALRTRDQCSPQTERDILLLARRTNSQWVPHLLCAFQTLSHLSIIMDYAEGGTLWDVLESSPYDGKILETDLSWWAPQIISAIHWCHSQGFVHRDVKPHNFVLTSNAHVLLIDFGSAAPLLPAEADGSQKVPKYHCLVPCGTCDYISPEILRAHEEALVALEMSEEGETTRSDQTRTSGYGRETDWWSMGAMLYEMAYGVAPFFAKDIKQTYLKITEHYKYLRFDNSITVSTNLKDLLRRLLTSSDLRLGRLSVDELQEHPFFEGTSWATLHEKRKPPDLHLPQFTYTVPIVPYDAVERQQPDESSVSRGFAFSALFESSPISHPSISIHHTTPSQARSILRDQPSASFIGFSWGPPADAFPDAPPKFEPSQKDDLATPRPLQRLSEPSMPLDTFTSTHQETPRVQRYPFATPMRPNAMTPHATLSRTGTVRRTAPRRAVSDREAMKQLVDCVGMSARKRVLESGRKPRILTSVSSSSALKSLRFDTSVMVVGGSGMSYKLDSALGSESTHTTSLSSGSVSSLPVPMGALDDSSTDDDSSVPPSPSPSPRPGSAMSMMSKRSQASTISSTYSIRSRSGSLTDTLGRRRLSTGSLTSFSGVSAATKPAEPVRDIPCLTDETLDSFGRRHALLMRSVVDIEGRLNRVLDLLGS
ncbi:kinase-like protein [Obba rivulosa]|uniref:non-specific serine/threonine protein kinase n=1 Tax=Obba rivulosa TaxID=1052685 RepID=A0A8E2ALR3_9APHY|nr:kinase-like protein [Obba rivulosa]